MLNYMEKIKKELEKKGHFFKIASIVNGIECEVNGGQYIFQIKNNVIILPNFTIRDSSSKRFLRLIIILQKFLDRRKN